MFNISQLEENVYTEFKAKLTDGFEREVVAFLNSKQGGDIYIGISDDKKIIGVEDVDKLQLVLQDKIKNNIEPSALGLYDIYTLKIEDKNIIKIVISRGTEKPYYIKKYGMSSKGCFVRIGSGVVPMENSMINSLFSSRTKTSLRNIVAPKQNLTFEQLKIYYATKNLNINDEFLKNLDLYTENNKFNYIAFLLADNNNISIKVAKYSGVDKVDLIENGEYGFCSLIKATKSVLDKLKIENRTFTKITGKAERFEIDMIDKVAIREALINAMVHNDYSREFFPLVEIYKDRFTITSYGGLVDGLDFDEMLRGRSMPRNRELMRIFKDLELVEHLGSGVSRILNAYNKDVFEISRHFFEVSFKFDIVNNDEKTAKKRRKNGEKTANLSNQEDVIYSYCLQNSKIDLKKAQQLLNVKNTRAREILSDLVKKDYLLKVGKTKGSYYILAQGMDNE